MVRVQAGTKSAHSFAQSGDFGGLCSGEVERSGTALTGDARMNFVTMERAGKFLAKLKLDSAISEEQLACSAWPAAVGGRIAKHSSAKSLVRSRLVIQVDDVVWQKQLYQLRSPILAKLREHLGDGVVNELEFRVAIPRRPPQPAQSLKECAVSDEADRISDPIMRILYKQARKKASA